MNYYKSWVSNYTEDRKHKTNATGKTDDWAEQKSAKMILFH